MHKVKSMFLTILCMGIILGIGYLVIMESGRKVLENGIMLEETDYENTSSNIFYGKIEEDIELFPWNYYPGDEAELGWQNDLGTHPMFQDSIMTGVMDTEEEELKALQGWYLCQLIAYKTDSEPYEVWSLFEERQHTIMDEICIVENSPIGALFFYQDDLTLGNKRYQVRISFTQWNVISFICIEDRPEEAQESGEGQASHGEQGSQDAQGQQGQLSQADQESGQNAQGQEGQPSYAAQEDSLDVQEPEGRPQAGNEAPAGGSQQAGDGQDAASGEADGGQPISSSHLGKKGQAASGDVQEGQMSGSDGLEEGQEGQPSDGNRLKNKQRWEEGKEKLVRILEESEAQMAEYFDYMCFLRDRDDTTYYVQGEYANCYLESLQWLERIQKGEDIEDYELSNILQQIWEIQNLYVDEKEDGAVYDAEGDADIAVSIENDQAEGKTEIVAEEDSGDMPYSIQADPEADPDPSFSYQIVDLKDMILLLMQGEDTLGIFYDPVAQEFCGYNFFYEY